MQQATWPVASPLMPVGCVSMTMPNRESPRPGDPALGVNIPARA